MSFDFSTVTADSVAADTDTGLSQADALVEDVVRRGGATFRDTMLPLDQALDRVQVAYGRGAFMARVHPDAAVRAAGQRSEERLAKWRVALLFRADLYRAIRAYAGTAEGQALEGERLRLVQHWLRDFRRAGQELPAPARDELERLRARLVELEVAFQRNVDEFQDGLELTREELAGLPDSYVDRLPAGTRPGTWRVGLEYPSVFPFLDQSERRDLREQLEFKLFNRAATVNRPVIAEALEIRKRIAALFGLPSWAHYALEVKMARDPEAVQRFYEELVPPLQSKARDEIARLGRLLEADKGDPLLRSWDWRYYDNQIRRTEFGLDQNLVAEYLPLERVMDGLLELTGEVFGLSYRRVEPARAWHPDVALYDIRDRATGSRIASFYADLFPREGKFGHAAVFQLVSGHRRPDGSYVEPACAIVANLTRPSADQPSLLRHDEVVTLFHEFGHVLHHSLSRTEFVRFSGTETEPDFVEAPSQIMEHWAWDASVLRRFARHYRTGDPMPEALVEELVRARDLDVGIRMLRQVSLGLLDMGFHDTSPERDLDAINRESWSVIGLPYHEGTFYAGGFEHLFGGYDAGYYGYLWSKVYGDDMFGRFRAEGVTNPEVGAAYRREILESGGSRDASEMLRAFLGREPSNATFLELLGIEPGPPA
jgi:thimet oligopeptidase